MTFFHGFLCVHGYMTTGGVFLCVSIFPRLTPHPAHYIHKSSISWLWHFCPEIFCPDSDTVGTQQPRLVMKPDFALCVLSITLFIIHSRCLIFPCPWMKTKVTLSLNCRLHWIHAVSIPDINQISDLGHRVARRLSVRL